MRRAPFRLGYLLIDGFALMSYAPVIEPFRAANLLTGQALYSWKHFSVTGDPALASNGVALSVDGGVDGMEGLDMLIVCAGGNPALFRDRRTLQALRRAGRLGTVIAGTSGAPFILARAGLLDGYRCTIHWEHEDAFLETFPDAKLERGLYVVDRDRVTCAGGMAGLDMAIELIAAENGPLLATRVSDWYIRTEQRAAGGPQRSSPGQRYRVWHKGLAAALAAMEANIAEPLPRDHLARIAGVTLRQLERLFARHMGCTIAAHYLRLRLDAASRLLRETELSRTEIAMACGFVNTSHFSRAFKERFSISPGALRQPARS